MHPVLFEFVIHGRDVTVKSYTFFLVLAAIAAIGLGAWIAGKRGLDARKSGVCLLMGLAATSVAARLIHWLTNPSSFSDGLGSVLSLGRSNLSVFAGLLLGVPVTAVTARKLRVDAWWLADSATPALAVAAALARVGCLLNGCCYGEPTRNWGIACAAGSDAHAAQIISGAIGLFDAPLPVHPTQLYEALAAIIGGLIAVWMLRRKLTDGMAFLVFVLWFTSFRWVNHDFLSTPTSFAAPHWLYPAIYALVIGLCCAALARRRKA